MLEKILILIPIISLFASVINQVIRQLTDGGVVVPKWALTVAAIVNIFSINIDKAMQMFSGYRGPAMSK